MKDNIFCNSIKCGFYESDSYFVNCPESDARGLIEIDKEYYCSILESRKCAYINPNGKIIEYPFIQFVQHNRDIFLIVSSLILFNRNNKKSKIINQELLELKIIIS